MNLMAWTQLEMEHNVEMKHFRFWSTDVSFILGFIYIEDLNVLWSYRLLFVYLRKCSGIFSLANLLRVFQHGCGPSYRYLVKLLRVDTTLFVIHNFAFLFLHCSCHKVGAPTLSATVQLVAMQHTQYSVMWMIILFVTFCSLMKGYGTACSEQSWITHFL